LLQCAFFASVFFFASERIRYSSSISSSLFKEWIQWFYIVKVASDKYARLFVLTNASLLQLFWIS
jgi:hypothetical protein